MGRTHVVDFLHVWILYLAGINFSYFELCVIAIFNVSSYEVASRISGTNNTMHYCVSNYHWRVIFCRLNKKDLDWE